MKPSALLAHALSKAYARDLAVECLQPLLDKYGLGEKGFELHEIRRVLDLVLMPSTPPTLPLLPPAAAGTPC